MRCMKKATADEEEMQYLMEETSTYQELLEHHDFYMIEQRSVKWDVHSVWKISGWTEM